MSQNAVWKKLISAQTGKTEHDFNAHLKEEEVNNQYQKYMSKFDHKITEEFDEKKYAEMTKERTTFGKAQEMVNAYYDIATDFYEYGWGQSFHFAPRFVGEDFQASLARHEYYLAHRLGIQKDDIVLDVGCGVGGPLRNICRFANCRSVGLNNNAYQVNRATTLNKRAGLAERTNVVKGDFMQMPFDDNTFNHVYAIEATCHAPDRTGVFAEIMRVLKEGGYFGVYEWVMTDKFDANNAKHMSIKHGIEEGNGVPSLIHWRQCAEHLKAAGFEVVDAFDLDEVAAEMGYPLRWYASFEGGCTLQQVKHTKLGRKMTQLFVDVLEAVKIAPTGTAGTHRMLAHTADALVDSGKTGIFTPMYFFLCRKPVKSTK